MLDDATEILTFGWW